MWEEWECLFFLSLLHFVPSEWIVAWLHSIGSIVKKKKGIFYCCHVLIISAIFSKPIHKFSSFPSAYNPAAPGPPHLKILCSSHPPVFHRILWVTLSCSKLKFSPLSNEQASFLYSFQECSVKFKWLKSCALP